MIIQQGTDRDNDIIFVITSGQCVVKQRDVSGDEIVIAELSVNHCSCFVYICVFYDSYV